MKGKLTKVLITTIMTGIMLVQSAVSVAYADNTKSISQNTITNRISGPDRYDTSMQLSDVDSDCLIIVNGLDFADALSASALAVKENASIILTNGKSIPYSLNYNLTTFQDMFYDKIIIVGGTSAVSTNIEKELKPYCTSLLRISGSDRYQTSYEVAKYIGNFGNAFVTTGLNYADALSASSVAAKKGSPILLTNGTSMNENILSLIKDKNVYILGGSSAVSTSIDGNFSNAKRIAGSDRYETNKKIVSQFSSEFTSGKGYVATGLNFPDALSVSAKAGKDSSPIILTNSTPTQATKDIIKEQNISELVAVGGLSVLSSTTMETLAGRTISTNANGSKSVAEIKAYAKSIGFKPLPNSGDTNLFLNNSNGTTDVWTAFSNNDCVSIPWNGYSETRTTFSIGTDNPVTHKNNFLPLLKMALPNSYQNVYDLICSNQNLKSQELYLDGKRVIITNKNYGIDVTVYYTNSTYEFEY